MLSLPAVKLPYLAAVRFRLVLRDAVLWWRQELAPLIPQSIRSLLGASKPFRVIEVEGDEIFVTWNGQRTAVGSEQHKRADIDDALVALEIPGELIIVQVISAPAAVAKRLDEALEFLIAQYSPFELGETFASARVRQIVENGTCSIELRYAVRSDVDSVIAKVTAQGLTPDRLLLGNGSDAIELDTYKQRQRRRRRWIQIGVLASPFLCATLLAWITIERQEEALQQLRAAITNEIKLAQQRRALEEKINDRIWSVSLPAQVQSSSIRNTAVLDAISRALPEGAYLREFEIANGRGRVVIVSSQDFDPMAALNQTELVRPSDTNVVGAHAGGEKLFSVGFSVSPGRGP